MQAIHLIWGSSSKKVITTGAGSLQKAALGDWECLCENPKVGQGRVKIGSKTERLWVLFVPQHIGLKTKRSAVRQQLTAFFIVHTLEFSPLLPHRCKYE